MRMTFLHDAFLNGCQTRAGVGIRYVNLHFLPDGKKVKGIL